MRESAALSEGIPLREAERAMRRLIRCGRCYRASLEEFYEVERKEWQARLDAWKFDQLQQKNPWVFPAISLGAMGLMLPYLAGKLAPGAAAV